MGGKAAEGLEHLEYSLRLLANAGRWDGVNRIGSRVIDELEERSFTDEARRIAAFVEELQAGVEAAERKPPLDFGPGTRPAAKQVRPILPTNCASCGAVIHPQEVEWADVSTVVCSYCGNMVRAEG